MIFVAIVLFLIIVIFVIDAIFYSNDSAMSQNKFQFFKKKLNVDYDSVKYYDEQINL